MFRSHMPAQFPHKRSAALLLGGLLVTCLCAASGHRQPSPTLHDSSGDGTDAAAGADSRGGDGRSVCEPQLPALDRLVRASAVVIEGDVAAVTSSWKAGEAVICTTVTLANVTPYKGLADAPDFEFTMLGGTVDDITMMLIPSQPHFVVGERAFVFLNAQYAEGRYPFVAGVHGVFWVETSSSGPNRARLVNAAAHYERSDVVTQILRSLGEAAVSR